MRQIDKVLQDLGDPYDIQIFDGEDCIHRKLGNYEFEVSNTNHKRCILYVWTVSPKAVVAIYENIPTEQLKDVLGYYACIYQKLTDQFRVVRQDTEV